MLAQIVDDRRALGNDSLLVRTSRSDANYWGFSKRMHCLQVWSCPELCIAPEDFDFIFEIQLLQQPSNALRARLLQPEVC